MRGFEQIFDQAAENKQRVNVNPTTTAAVTANPPRIPPIAPPQTKDDKPTPQQTRATKVTPGPCVRIRLRTLSDLKSLRNRSILIRKTSMIPPLPTFNITSSHPAIVPRPLFRPLPTVKPPLLHLSPFIHLPPGGYDLEQLRNAGSPYPHPFSHVRRNAYAAARTPSIAYDPTSQRDSGTDGVADADLRAQ